MMIRVPYSVPVPNYRPPLFPRQLSGLGQDDGSSIDTTSGTDTTDYTDVSTSLPLAPLTLPTLEVTPPSNPPSQAEAPYGYDELGDPLTSLPNLTLSPISTSSVPTSSQLAAVITQGTSSGLTSTQISQIISNAVNAGVAVFKATSSPSLIPGTNLVYNPATGQVTNATYGGLTTSQTAALAGGLSIQTLLIFGVIFAALMLLKEGK